MEKDNDLLMGLKDRRALKALVEKSINRGELENFYSVLSLASKQDFSVEDFELFVNGDVLKDILEFRDEIEAAYGGDEKDCYGSKRYNRFEDLVVMLNMLPVDVSNKVFLNDEAIDLISSLNEERFNRFCEELDLNIMDTIIDGLDNHAQGEKVETLCEWKYAKEHANLRKTK